jgi:carbon dioxide concentrating mechanism protein CcmM
VKVDGKEYSIFIDKKVSVAHGALIHGPCFIGKNVFVGFKIIVYDVTVEDGVFIAYNAVVTNGVHVRRNRFVPPGAYIDTQKKADALSRVPTDAREFAREVQRVNQEFPLPIICCSKTVDAPAVWRIISKAVKKKSHKKTVVL